jgi:hypothetical protein
MSETRFCKFCNCDHPLTEEFWYRLEGSPRCKEQVLQKVKARAALKDSEIKQYQKQYRDTHKEGKAEGHKEYRRKIYADPELHRQQKEKWAAYEREQRRTNPQHKLRTLLRQRICNVMKRTNQVRAGSAVRDLGCSVEELKIYLESKFREGMTWENHGEWHIDHIIPLNSFNLANRKEFLKACHYTNLQPLWAEENLKKSDKLLVDSNP